MTTTTKNSTKLLCPECRRENEPERVFCHDCGTRLDRSAVRVKKEPIADTQKRVKRMFDPQRAKIRALFFATNKTIIGAAMTAVVVAMFLPPEIPEPNKNQMLVSSLRFDLENMVRKRQPLEKKFSEEEINAFLASLVKSKQSTLDKPLLAFRRVLVTLHEQRCSITVERAISGYWPVYTTCIYSPDLKDGRLTAKAEGGFVGRLPVHPKLAQFMHVLFGDLKWGLEPDIKLLSKLGALDVHEKSVTLSAPAP